MTKIVRFPTNHRLPPDRVTGINWRVPHAQGLRAFWPFWGQHAHENGWDVAFQNPLSPTGTGVSLTPSYNEDDNAIALGKRDQQRALTITRPITYGTTDDWTLSLRCRRRTGSTLNHGMVAGDNTTTNSFIWVYATGSFSTTEIFQWRNSGGNNFTWNNFVVDVSLWHTITMTVEETGSATNADLWVDGAFVATQSSSAGRAGMTFNTLFDGYTGYSLDFDGDLMWASLHDGVLPDEGITALHDSTDMWQLFQTPAMGYHVPAAAAGGGFTSGLTLLGVG